MTVNLFRDQFHVKPLEGFVDLGSSTLNNGKTVVCSSNGIVNQTTGMVSYFSRRITTAIPEDNHRAAGILIRPPIVDSTPYMVRAYTYTSLITATVFAGFAQEDPDGVNDTIEECTFFPIGSENHEIGSFKEVLLMPEALTNRPLCFGIAFTDGKANCSLSFTLSVQNLAQTAPQFAASMS